MATSAKTLDSDAASYVREPRRVFASLKAFIDRIHNFSSYRAGGYEIIGSAVKRRRLVVAIRAASTERQIAEVNRAHTYAESLGVEMNVVLIR